MLDPFASTVAAISVIFAGATVVLTVLIALIALFAFWGRRDLEKKMVSIAEEKVSKQVYENLDRQLKSATSPINVQNSIRIRSEVERVVAAEISLQSSLRGDDE